MVRLYPQHLFCALNSSTGRSYTFFSLCETPRHCFGGALAEVSTYIEHPQQSTGGIAPFFLIHWSWFSWNHLKSQSILIRGWSSCSKDMGCWCCFFLNQVSLLGFGSLRVFFTKKWWLDFCCSWAGCMEVGFERPFRCVGDVFDCPCSFRFCAWSWNSIESQQTQHVLRLKGCFLRQKSMGSVEDGCL